MYIFTKYAINMQFCFSFIIEIFISNKIEYGYLLFYYIVNFLKYITLLKLKNTEMKEMYDFLIALFYNPL